MTKKGWQQGLYRNTPWCIVTRRKAEGRAVLRPRPRHGQVRAQHTPTIRQPVRSRYGHGGLRHARHDAQGRGARRAGVRGTAHAARRAGRAHERGNTAAWAAIRQGASATTRPSLPTIRPSVRAPGRACARLGVPN